MKGVPPEIDTLLWRLAEDGSPVAREEFETRHARYGPELSRRIKMVEELRAAGKTAARRPAFTPRPLRASPPSVWTIGSAMALTVFAVGAIAYVVASGGERPQKVGIERPPSVPPRVAQIPERPVSNTRKEVPSPESPPIAQNTPPSGPQPDYLTPRDVRIAGTNLATAIQLVAQGGGLRVTVAPGFEDRRVTLDYRGLNTVETLKAMGEEYGFSVLDEEEGHILVIPVRQNGQSAPRIGG